MKQDETTRFDSIYEINTTHLALLFWCATTDSRPFPIAGDDDIRWKVLQDKGLISGHRHEPTKKGWEAINAMVTKSREIADKAPPRVDVADLRKGNDDVEGVIRSARRFSLLLIGGGVAFVSLLIWLGALR